MTEQAILAIVAAGFAGAGGVILLRRVYAWISYSFSGAIPSGSAGE